MKKNKKEIKIILVLVAIILIYSIYYLYKQHNIKILGENEFYINVDDKSDIDDIAQKWVEGYLMQYTGNFVKTNMRIESMDIKNVYVYNFDENIVCVDFSIKKTNSNSKYFEDWYAIHNNDTNKEDISWVLVFDVKNNKTCYLKERMTVSAYQARTYKSSGQEDKELDYINNKKEEKFITSDYLYKFYNNILYISYESGNEWEKVPLDTKNLLYSDANKEKLKDGTFQISPTKTSFIYKTDSGIYITYSDNMAKTWDTVKISNEYADRLYNVNNLYINFISKDIGKVLITYNDNINDNSKDVSSIYNTSDGGKNFSKIGEFKNELVSSNTTAKFITKDVGFILNSSKNDKNAVLYRSDDGGITFIHVELPEIKLNTDAYFYEIYNNCTMPEKENEQLIVKLSQVSDEKYNGKTTLTYVSTDLGKSWKYLDSD